MTIAEQLAAAAVTDSLAAARTEEEWPIMGWAASRGTFGSSSVGWKPPGYAKKEPTGSQGGAIYKVAKRTGNSFVALSIQNTYGLINTVGEVRSFSVWLFTPGSGANANGYQLKMMQASSGSGTPHKYKFQLSKYVEGTQTLFEETGEVTIETEGSFALAIQNGVLSMWRRETAASEWVQVGSEFSDATYTEGYSAIDGDGSNPILNNFKTGALEATGEVVRQFSRSPSSELVTSNGGITGGELSMVALVKYEEDGNIAKTVNASNEDIEPNPQMAINLGGLLSHGTAVSPSLKPAKGTWSLVGYSKTPGTSIPRQHLYDFATGTWTHANCSSSRGEGTPSEWGKWRIAGKTNAVGPFKGAIAAVARFNKVLTDAQFESLVNAEAIGAWSALSPAPVMLWEFGQTAVAQEVKDLIGTANQTSRVETTVLSEAPPMPYGTLGALVGKYVKVLVGGALREAKRWIKLGGSLVSK